MLKRMAPFSLCLWLAVGALPGYTEEVPRLTFAQLVDGLRANNEVTQKIKSYNGKVVELQGFIIPAGPPDLSFFLLSRVSVLGNLLLRVAHRPGRDGIRLHSERCAAFLRSVTRVQGPWPL